jgi:hypothetical protein
MTLSGADASFTLRLLAESQSERRIRKIQTEAHQYDEDGDQEESGNQRIFHARRTSLTEKCAQGLLLCATQ